MTRRRRPRRPTPNGVPDRAATLPDTVANLRAAADAALTDRTFGGCDRRRSERRGRRQHAVPQRPPRISPAGRSTRVTTTGTSGTIEDARFQDLGDPITTSIEYYDNLGSPHSSRRDVGADRRRWPVEPDRGQPGRLCRGRRSRACRSNSPCRAPRPDRRSRSRATTTLATDTLRRRAGAGGPELRQRRRPAVGRRAGEPARPGHPRACRSPTAPPPRRLPPQTLDLNIGAMRTFDRESPSSPATTRRPSSSATAPSSPTSPGSRWTSRA